MIENIIAGATTARQIKKRLKDAGIVFVDLTEEYGYMNLRIPMEYGYFRIYRNGKRIKTQKWTKTEIIYSGIPVFEPSGRRSF